MLFNSYAFIFVFLPVTALGFFLLGARSARLAAGWLALASLFFYGYWSPVYVLLLLASIGFNFLAGRRLADLAGSTAGKRLLTGAIAANLGLLGYYKYANFFVDNFNALFGSDVLLGQIVLPLGISFFTFTQIAFLVDAYRGEAKEYRFVHYVLFVTYFPHLIAGPVLHHKEMMPQFAQAATYRPSHESLAVGITLFSMGLFKKVVLADNVAVYVAPVFDAAAHGTSLSFFDAWGGALAYTLQLYFDFSGYSDMAIGLSRLFGIRLPLNFDSPYRAENIIDFWRRWHMTLSRFLRDYLYIPLGGSRKGPVRRYLNLMVTMLLGGLWHGAGWTYVIWGGLHGFYLMVNHAWRGLKETCGWVTDRPGRLARLGSHTLTFAAVVVAWVFFRAQDTAAAFKVLGAMTGLDGIPVPSSLLAHVPTGWTYPHFYAGGTGDFFQWPEQPLWIAALLLLALLFPNTQTVMSRYRPALGHGDDVQPNASLRWRPAYGWLALIAAMDFTTLAQLDRVSEFLYFQF
ncbi:MBOAT family protein [Methylococcus sp. EFPC2]|uniref:MBOAT family O-acyltransferase n=1 Tax=Methylococcus sp. EFPC2 TaxID=2812648 RepID=UPI0019682EA1|nr:MBOAT family protein [Methylococcus sp. EFPC2]QSA96968.1 MBOAT family protein [Methylococcus sp. EFPC2]